MVADRRGFLLLSVLWIVALAAMVIVAASVNTQTVIDETAPARGTLHLEALTSTALSVAAARIASRADATQLSGSFSVTNEMGTAAGTFRNSAAFVDLNMAPMDLLAGMLALAEIASPERRWALAGRIVDWRDDDGQRIVDGEPESNDYGGTSHPAPKNGPFSTPFELAQVPGWSEQERRRVHSVVTASSGIATVHPALVDPRILAAVPGVDPQVATRLGDLRPGAGDQIRQITAEDPVLQALVSQTPSSSWRVEIALAPADGPSSNAVAIITFVPNDRRLFRVVSFDAEL